MPLDEIKTTLEATAKTIDAVTGLVDAVGVKDLVQLGASMAHRGVDAGSKAYAKKSEERSALVEVPEMYSSDYRLKLDDAIRWLEEDGLRAEAVILQPDVAYKDCSDLEVVATNYKLGKKVKVGTRIILKYVTSDVIEASRKLFDDAESQKAEQAMRNKENIDKTVANFQQGFGNVATSTQKGIKDAFSKFSKKDK